MQQKKWWSLGIIMLLMAMFALTGCGGGGEAALIGTWKVDTSSMPTPAVGGSQAQQMGAAMAQGMFSNVNIEFKSDKTFAMNMFIQMGGDWTFNEADNTVTLNATKMGNMDVSKMPNASQKKPLIFTLSSDKQHLTMQPPTGQSASSTMTFVKS